MESVVLLHGMAMPSMSMALIAADLRTAGYDVVNVHYPTGTGDVRELVERYVGPAISERGADRPVHVVTHSLGGILIRQYLQDRCLPPGSRIVMLVPPNQGSEVADRVRRWPPYRWLTGRVGQQLGTGADSIVKQLRPVTAEIGIIAANRSLQPWFAHLIREPNDGVVAVSSARLAEMRDFIVIGTSHSIIVFNAAARVQIRHFLAHGAFDRADRGVAD
jgi:pimeloyl-ACP methyl ester carboxylesterase